MTIVKSTSSRFHCCEPLIEIITVQSLFASVVITSYSNTWIMLLLLCTSGLLVLCCDRFNHGSRGVKRDSLDLVMEDHDIMISLCWRIRWYSEASLCMQT